VRSSDALATMSRDRAFGSRITDTESSDGSFVGTANSLRDYFSSENFKPEGVVTNYPAGAAQDPGLSWQRRAKANRPARTERRGRSRPFRGKENAENATADP
jgi:hypothetical protein